MKLDLIRKHGLSVLAALLALAVVVLGVALYLVDHHDDRPRAGVGEVYDAPISEEKIAHTGTAYLPWAELEVGFGDRQDELPSPTDASPANLRAPDGGSFVRVRAETAATFSMVSTAFPPPPMDIEIVLRAGGKDYPLTVAGGFDLDIDTFEQEEGDRWVAVEGHPDDVELRITVDGVTQVVDSDGPDAGRSEALGEVPTSDELRGIEPVGCGSHSIRSKLDLELDPNYNLRCTVSTGFRTPYIAGLGWAEDGHEFYVVQVDPSSIVQLRSTSDDRREAWETEATWSATLGGQPSMQDSSTLKVLYSSLPVDGDSEHFVFTIPEGERVGDLVVHANASRTLKDPFADRSAEKATIEWTIPGRKLP